MYFDDLQLIHCDTLPRCTASIDTRFADSHSIQFVRRGSVRLRIDHGPVIRIDGPSLFWLHADRHYQYEPWQADESGYWHHNYAVFVGDRGRRYLDEALDIVWPMGYRKLDNAAEFADTFDTMRAQFHNHGEDHRGRIIALLETLIAMGVEPPRSSSQYEWVHDLAATIRSNPTDSFDYQFEADSLNMTPTHLRRLFKRLIGVPPHEYLLRQRMRYAAERIVNGDLSITNIARELGYEDLAQFSKLFKSKIGLSPRQYQASVLHD